MLLALFWCVIAASENATILRAPVQSRIFKEDPEV
jgi:hypothetical protein